MFQAYEKACKEGAVKLGKIQIHDLGGLVGGPRWIINFPTKGHWRSKSQISDIVEGLKDLVSTIQKLHIRSIALPPLGCGNGGLDWKEVRPRIEASLAELARLFHASSEGSVQSVPRDFLQSSIDHIAD